MAFREISSSNQIKDNLQTLQSVPPGCQNQKIKGIFNLKVQTTYLNTCRQSTSMKCKLWGMPGEAIKFVQVSQTTKEIRLSIRSRLQTLSKYFNDMKVFCIQIYTLLEQERQIPLGLEKRNKTIKQNRQVGWIFVNIQRYIVNHILNNFQQTVSIVDLRKQKIGEAQIKVTIEMFKQVRILSNQELPSIKNTEQDKKPASYHFEEDKNFSQNHTMQEKEQKKRNIIPNKDPGYRNSVIQSIDYEKQLEKHRNRIDLEKNLFSEMRRKGKAQIFLEQYEKNKPQHTQLSIIRQKYGFNIPSVEILKLKYDEARLLTNFDQKVPKNEARLNLLLKSIKMQGKNKGDFLVIYYEQKQAKLRTETKLILPEQVGNKKVEINYLYTIPNNPLDTLIFQMKDAQYQTQISELSKTDRVQIKNNNGKRICIIQFVLVSQNGVKKSNLAQAQQASKLSEKEAANPSRKAKENAYISVLNWKQDKITLKNSNFGLVKASKLLFQVNQTNSNDFSIELEHQNKEKSVLQLSLIHLFKQQNYLINGVSVKVITSKGQLPQILALIEKLQPQKQSKNRQIPVQQDTENSESLKELVKIYVNLQQCQNVQCNQFLEELSSSHTTSTKKLQKFASLINIQINAFKRVLNTHFQSKFELFYFSFRVFHEWNHKYKILQKKIKNIASNDLIKHFLFKTVKKVKKSSELMFGLISTNFFINQFIKQTREREKIADQQDENQTQHQQIGKLIAMVFERYFNRCIKISQVQEFITQSRSFVNLNIYVLSKMAVEIINQKEEFDMHLNRDSEHFINIFHQRLHQGGELGLARLLLTSEEEYMESSVLSVQQNARRHTQQNVRKQTEFRYEDQKNKTGQDKNPFRKEGLKTQSDQGQKHKQFFEKPQGSQSQYKVRPKNITIIIKNAKILSETRISQIVLTCQKQTVILNNQLLRFPKAFVLIDNMVYHVEVKAQEEAYQGLFLAYMESRRVKLYRKQKQCGYLQLFGQSSKIASQQSQVVLKLTTQQKSNPKQELASKLIRQPEKYQEMNVNMDSYLAQSPQIKMTIRSIRPTRNTFKLQISNQSNTESKYFDFPNQNQLVLRNSLKGWKLQLISQQYQQINVMNQKGSNTYCFLSPNDQKVGYVIVIEISECWNASPVLNQAESLHICLNLDQFISLNDFQSNIYSVVLQVDKEAFQIGTINNSTKSRKLRSQLSYVLNKQNDETILKLIQNQTKSQVCSFKFMSKLIQNGIQSSERFLIGDRDCYRLKITIFQIRYEWTYCKPDRIVSLFTYPHKKVVQSFVNSNPSTDEQRLIFWLKNNFQLTLGQIQILFNDVMSAQSGKHLKSLQRLFRQAQQAEIPNRAEVFQQFTIFDLTEKGFVSSAQMALVKRILQKNFKQISVHLQKNYNKFIVSPEREENFIVDLAKIQNKLDFDYLSFLSTFEEPFQPKQIPKKQKQNNIKNSRSNYLSLKLLSFNKLSINGAPGTLLFKINGKNLAQPIHRCYSHTYSDPSEIIIKNEGTHYLQICCQRLSSQGNWQYKQIEKAPLYNQIKILGGTIVFDIKQTNERGEEPISDGVSKQKRQVQTPLLNQQRKQNLNQQRKQNLQAVNIKRQDDFQKSFWNKSLNETRQKWLNANKLGTEKKESRKVFEIGKEEIKKKMDVFSRQWDD